MPPDCLAIVLDLADYNFGTDRGGELNFFDDFDIDFNQYKYLYEVYMSGALVLPYSAQIYMRVDAEDLIDIDTVPAPTVDANVITVPTMTGVVYTNADTGAVLVGGSSVNLTESNKQVKVEAIPAAGFQLSTDADVKDSWTFRYKA
jgi:hypothetical protein